MDIKWKDSKGNILNADKNRIIYLNAETNTKLVIRNDEIKKITIVDGMMNVFKDFQDDLALTVIIPKKSKRDAVRVFNEYDKTGKMLKGKSSNFLWNLMFESSVVLGNPFAAIALFASVFFIIFSILVIIVSSMFGDYGANVVRAILLLYPLYLLVSHIILIMKRKKLKEYY